MAWRTVVHWLEPFLGEREQLALGARGTLGGDHRDRGARLGGESQAAGRHEVTGRAKRQESEHVVGRFTGSGGVKDATEENTTKRAVLVPVECGSLCPMWDRTYIRPQGAEKAPSWRLRKPRDNERHGW